MQIYWDVYKSLKSCSLKVEYQRLILKGAAKAFHREVAAEYQCLFLQEGTIFTLSSGPIIMLP